MKSVKGTLTEQNLLKSFAGESQARNRYTFFASAAKKEGFEQISGVFMETAEQEKEHAKKFFKYLEGGDVTITANWKVNSYKYIVYHNQQSVDGTAYNKVANDTVTDNADYGTTVTPKANTYTGFLSPTTKDLVIDVDEDPPIKNIVNYDYARQKFNI